MLSLYIIMLQLCSTVSQTVLLENFILIALLKSLNVLLGYLCGDCLLEHL